MHHQHFRTFHAKLSHKRHNKPSLKCVRNRKIANARVCVQQASIALETVCVCVCKRRRRRRRSNWSAIIQLSSFRCFLIFILNAKWKTEREKVQKVINFIFTPEDTHTHAVSPRRRRRRGRKNKKINWQLVKWLGKRHQTMLFSICNTYKQLNEHKQLSNTHTHTHKSCYEIRLEPQTTLSPKICMLKQFVSSNVSGRLTKRFPKCHNIVLRAH